MVNCPKCDMEGLKWCETKNKRHWLKKDLGEGQTGREWHECDNPNVPARHGWLKIECEECHIITNYNRKHYTERTIPRPCRDCNLKKFNNLGEYGLSL